MTRQAAGGADPSAPAQLTPGDDIEIKLNRELIMKSRKSIEDGKQHFADSCDRLVESQSLLRRVSGG
jgi:hypothetical protein